MRLIILFSLLAATSSHAESYLQARKACRSAYFRTYNEKVKESRTWKSMPTQGPFSKTHLGHLEHAREIIYANFEEDRTKALLSFKKWLASRDPQLAGIVNDDDIEAVVLSNECKNGVPDEEQLAFELGKLRPQTAPAVPGEAVVAGAEGTR